MPADTSSFAALMNDADPVMTVVTTVAGDERAGCLVGFHAQCSIEPARYAVWLSKANHTYRVALLGDHLAVHFLASGDRPLAELFGEVSGDEVDKFERCSWSPGAGGVPLLDACPNRVVGRRETLMGDRSDHVCVVIEPVEVARAGPFRPLRFSDVRDLDPGHRSEERPQPPTEHAG